MKKAEDLFAAWETPMVRACLQGHMGRVHAQGEDSALASIGDFCFLAGEPSPELLELADAPILVPGSGWESGPSPLPAMPSGRSASTREG